MRPQYTSTYQLLACCKLEQVSCQVKVEVKPHCKLSLQGLQVYAISPLFGALAQSTGEVREIFKKYLKSYMCIYILELSLLFAHKSIKRMEITLALYLGVSGLTRSFATTIRERVVRHRGWYDKNEDQVQQSLSNKNQDSQLLLLLLVLQLRPQPVKTGNFSFSLYVYCESIKRELKRSARKSSEVL